MDPGSGHSAPHGTPQQQLSREPSDEREDEVPAMVTSLAEAAAQALAAPTAPSPLLDKILGRFKMLRRANNSSNSRGSTDSVHTVYHTEQEAAQASQAVSVASALQLHRAPTPPGSSLPTSSPTSTPKCTSTATNTEADDLSLDSPSTGCIFTDPKENGTQKFRVQDLGPFCEQLDHLLDYIRSTTELNKIIYSYPSVLQDRLDAQACELHTIYLEARAAKMRIQQVKNQRKAIQKECNARTKTLASVREEEIKEMENYIAFYDKTLLSRWEKIRSSTQKDIVESYIQDIKGKQKALDYLHTLATNKLHQMNIGKAPSTAPDETKPVNIALRRLSNNSGARGSMGRWRNKHYERPAKVPSSNTSQDSNLEQVVPLATAPLALTFGRTLPGAISSESSATSSNVSAFTSASSTFIPTNTPADQRVESTNSMPTSQPPSDVAQHPSALQALFSDIQQLETHDNLPIDAVMPHLIRTSMATAEANRQTGNQIQNNSRISLTDNNVDLHTLHHSS